MACLRLIPPSWSGLLGWLGGRLPRQLVLRGRCSDRVPDRRVAQAANPRATSAGRRALPDPWTSARWTAGGERGIPVVASVSRPPVTSASGEYCYWISLFTFLATLSPMDLVQPVLPCGSDGLALLNVGRVARFRESGNVQPAGERRADAVDIAREHHPGTSPGRWHAARRQMTGGQICTPCCLRRPAPQGVQHQPAKSRFRGDGPGDEEISVPDRLRSVLAHPRSPTGQPHGAAPRDFRGVTPRANQEHRSNNGIPSPGESG